MRPANLLVITSDEHNPLIMGAAGNQVVRTPRLDRLAAAGVRFRNAYCNSPVCVPARAVMATGRYAHTTRNWDNSSPYTGSEAPSWGHALSALGHHVTTIGKLHFRDPADPTGFTDQRLPLHVVDGVGDLYALLRGDAPPAPGNRNLVAKAGPGDSAYLRYDAAVAQAATHWLRDEAPGHAEPWVLSVNFVNPHFPLRPPREHAYQPDEVPLPPQALPDEWPRHPAITDQRRLMDLADPFDEAALRNAIAAYYGLVSYLDARIGAVLDALDATGHREDTRIIYLSDHGDMAGAHGLWWKHTMYRESVGIPLIMVPLPDEQVPTPRVDTNVSQIDLYPTILEAVTGVAPHTRPERPGRSLWQISAEPHHDRVVFAEYHAMYSRNASFMIANQAHKYIHHVGFPPQLFDLHDDPHEKTDLAEARQAAIIRDRMESRLREIVVPEEADAACKHDGAERLAAAGGPDVVRKTGKRVVFTPPPAEFRQLDAR